MLTSAFPSTAVNSTDDAATQPSTTVGVSVTRAPNTTRGTTPVPSVTNAPLPTTVPVPTSPPTTPPPTAAVLTADAVAGRWSGTVDDGHGNPFGITFNIRAGCRLGDACGTVYVDSLPCDGDITFYAYAGGVFEFDVVRFRSGSSSSCQPGPGEYLSVLSSTRLKYTTNYGPSGFLARS